MEGTGRHGKPQMIGLGGPEVRGPWSVVDSSVHAHRARGAHPLFFLLGWVGLGWRLFPTEMRHALERLEAFGRVGGGGGGEGKRHIRDVNVCGETNREQHHLRCLFGRTEWWWCRGGMVVEVGVADAWTPPSSFFPSSRATLLTACGVYPSVRHATRAVDWYRGTGSWRFFPSVFVEEPG